MFIYTTIEIEKRVGSFEKKIKFNEIFVVAVDES